MSAFIPIAAIENILVQDAQGIIRVWRALRISEGAETEIAKDRLRDAGQEEQSHFLAVPDPVNRGSNLIIMKTHDLKDLPLRAFSI